MTEDEIIAVVKASKDGKRIECRMRYKTDAEWRQISKPQWNFENCDYRVVEPKWRDATIDDLKRAPLPCKVREDFGEWEDDMLIGYVASSIGLKWMVRGEFRYAQCQVQDDT